LEQHLSSDALVEVDVQHLFENTDAVISQIVSNKFYSATLNPSVQLGIGLSFKREVTIE
jgi:hypothetical protein